MEDLSGIGQSPIRADKPAGESIRYDADFETLKVEIAKLDSLTGEEVAWKEVRSLARGILEKKSKDILVASYLTAALFQTSSYPGLNEGFKIYIGLLDNFWDDLFPEAKRMRGRVAAVQWLVERLTKWVEHTAPASDEAADVREGQKIFDAFFDKVRDKFANDSPGMGDLKRAFEMRVMDLPKEKPPEPERPADAPTAGTAAQRPAPRPAAAPAAEIETPQDALKAVKDVGLTIRTAATVLRKANPLDPLPYRLVRFASWNQLKVLPPNQGGQTQLPAPRAEAIAAAQNLVNTGDWANLLELGEGRAADTPFWLDANRFSATALSSLGPGHEAARDAVITELAGLLKRLPGLLDLRFQGGVPFADDQTRLWVEAEVQAALGGGGGGGGGGATPSAGAGADPLEEATGEARKLLAGGKFAEAMTLFQRGAASADGLRDRFRWKLALAEACHNSGQTELAMHQLESLDRESEQFRLDEWEPPLCRNVVGLLYLCQKKLLAGPKKPLPDQFEAANRTYARLCRIDPIRAMEMK